MAPLRVHVWIHGEVQGVYFRASTQRQARAAGVTGWVRNCYDGSVEAVFEGDTTAVHELVRWCHHGPASAVVTDVDMTIEPYTGTCHGFNVVG